MLAMASNLVKQPYCKERIYDPEKIRKARCDAGLNRTQLAAKIGMSESAISRVEAGNRQNPNTIVLIAKALKKHPSAFHFDGGRPVRRRNERVA